MGGQGRIKGKSLVGMSSSVMCVCYFFPIIIPHLLTFPPPPHSHSDGEPISEPPLVPVAAAPVEAQSIDSTLLSKLYQLVARQQVELQQLQEEHQRSFVLLQQQLEEMRVSTVEQHRASLTEHAREQRILHQDIKTVAQWRRIPKNRDSFSPAEMKDTLLIMWLVGLRMRLIWYCIREVSLFSDWFKMSPA